MHQSPISRFQRLLLPGFAFKAVVIGGGYATGRELVAFFLPSGPRGGLYGMLLSMVIWSAVCILTFPFALQTNSRDYRTFFRHLLGALWPAFEVSYALAMVVILAVYAAAAGAIGQAIFAWPPLAGSLILVSCIVLVAVWGNEGVERLFKYVTFFLYGTYALFVLLSLIHFGGTGSHRASLSAATAVGSWPMLCGRTPVRLQCRGPGEAESPRSCRVYPRRDRGSAISLEHEHTSQRLSRRSSRVVPNDSIATDPTT